MLSRDLEDAIAGRELGHYALSIATSLAIEGMTGHHPDTPTPSGFRVSRYEAFLVNVDTMIRNFMGSIPSEVRASIQGPHIAQVILDEIPILTEVMKEISPTTQVIFYHTPYVQVQSTFPNAKHKTLSKGQAILRSLADEALKILQGQQAFTVLPRVDTGHSRALLLTHKPMDLLKGRRYKELILAESHTGRLKAEKDWWTKLHRCEMPHMPFNGFTLQLYGDNLYMATQTIKYKRLVESIADQHRWTYTTTLSRIRMGLSGIREKELREPLMALLDFRSDVT